MSGPADVLHRLYETERGLRTAQERIAQLRSVLEGDPKAADARPRLLIAEADRTELSRRLERAESHERVERARARSHEQQLYSGAIHNPRELSQLAEELEHLKGRLATEEVEEMELLAALEDADREVSDALGEAATVRVQLEEHEKMAEEAGRSIADQRATIPPAHLRLYDRVATFRPAPPVVAVQNGVCAGCRLPISLNQARALRSASDPLVCETCGRILIAP